MNMAKPHLVRIKFIRDASPKEGGDFVKDQIVELTAGSAERWVRREAAKIIEGSPPAPQSSKSKSGKDHK